MAADRGALAYGAEGDVNVKNPTAKLRDEDLICECGHLYHSHTRIWNPHTKLTSFSHCGSCTACDCTAYKFSGKLRKRRER